MFSFPFAEQTGRLLVQALPTSDDEAHRLKNGPVEFDGEDLDDVRLMQLVPLPQGLLVLSTGGVLYMVTLDAAAGRAHVSRHALNDASDRVVSVHTSDASIVVLYASLRATCLLPEFAHLSTMTVDLAPLVADDPLLTVNALSHGAVAVAASGRLVLLLVCLLFKQSKRKKKKKKREERKKKGKK